MLYFSHERTPNADCSFFICGDVKIQNPIHDVKAEAKPKNVAKAVSSTDSADEAFADPHGYA
jgi:hypothetical protein